MEPATGNNRDIHVFAEEFLGNLTTNKYTPPSVNSYRFAIRRFAAFIQSKGKSSPLEITPQDLADYRLSLVERRLKQNSMYAYLRVVRLFLGYLHERDHVFVNPAVGMEMVGADRRLQPVPTEDEIRMLLSLPAPTNPEGIRDRAILETMYSTALRNGETVNMNVEDVNLTESTIRVLGKGSRERIVPLGRVALDWLKRYLEARDNLLDGNTEESALWLNTRGMRLSGQLLNILVKTYARSCAQIRTPVTTHSLRRACATHMLQRGASPVEIQLLLGHADMKHLRNYLRVSIFDLKAAHEKTRVAE